MPGNPSLRRALRALAARKESGKGRFVFLRLQHLLVLEAQAAIGATTQKITAEHLQEWLVNVLKTPMKILILSEGESQLSGQIKGRHQFFVTHSPYDFVLQSNDLKKVAWSVMQNFIL